MDDRRNGDTERSSRFVPVWRSQNLVLSLDGTAPQAAFLARHEILLEGETALLGIDPAGPDATWAACRTRWPTAHTAQFWW